MTVNIPRRVVKVGGSLLRYQPRSQAMESPRAALARWLARQSPAVHVFVAGGGEFADLIRRADETDGLSEEASHWLCVDALSVTARLLGALLDARVVSRCEELPPDESGPFVFDPAPFLRGTDARSPSPLPHSWSVTSDSIAARLAQALDASELVLLKSCLPATATSSYVDSYFPIASAPLRSVRCVNLLSPDFDEVPWNLRP